jgi:hypothetical protein
VPDAVILDNSPESVKDMEIDDQSESDTSSSVESGINLNPNNYSDAVLSWAEQVNSMDKLPNDFGNHDVLLYCQLLKYKHTQWTQMMAAPHNKRLGLPDPGDDTATIYRVKLDRWAADGPLRCDSTRSFAESVRKMIFYTHYFDSGLADPAFAPSEKAPYYLVPPDFVLFPKLTEDELDLSIKDLLGEELYAKVTNYAQSPTDQPAPSNSATSRTQSSALRPSSFGRPVIKDPESKSGLQLLLSRTSEAQIESTLSTTEEPFLATAVFQPEQGFHPISNMLEGSKIILASGRTIDSSFQLRCLVPELESDHPPLCHVDDPHFPNDYKTAQIYMTTPGWQLTLVKPGQKDQNGRPKQQPTIYATIRITSKFQPNVIISYLKPDLDALGIGLSHKNFQSTLTEIRISIFAVSTPTPARKEFVT